MRIRAVAVWVLLCSWIVLAVQGVDNNLILGVRKATENSLESAQNSARRTGETIRHAGATTYEAVKEAAATGARKPETVPRKVANTVINAVKGASQSAAEKIGIAIPRDSMLFHQEHGQEMMASKLPKYGIYGEVHNPTAAEYLKEKGNKLKDDAGEGMSVLKDGLAQGAHGLESSLGQARDWVQHCANDAGQVVVTGAKHQLNKAASYSAQLKEPAVKTGEWVQHGAEMFQNAGQDSVSATKEKLSDAATIIKEGSDEAMKLSIGTEKDMESRLHSLGETAGTGAKTVQEFGIETIADITDRTGQAKDSFTGRMKAATDEVSETLKRNAHAAATYMPNVGQGLSMGASMEDCDDHTKQPANTYVDSTKGNLSPEACDAGGMEATKWRPYFLSKASDKLQKGGEVVLKTKDALFSKVSECCNKMDGIGQETSEGAREALQNATASNTVVDTENQLKQFFLGDSGVDELNTHRKLKTKSAFWRHIGFVTTAWILSLFRILHLFSFSAAYGASLWVTFFSGHVLSRILPGKQFRLVQSKIYPTYLKVIASGQMLCLVFYLILHPWSSALTSERLQHSCLWGTILSTLANIFFLEPRTTKMEKEQERGWWTEQADGSTHLNKKPLSQDDRRLKTFQGSTSMLNLVGLVGLTCHMLHLSRKLVI